MVPIWIIWRRCCQRTQFWLCGPVGFMQFIAGQLRDAGVDAARIH
ncbi:hypothetical protein [Candidatus Pantoea persica]|nr:hypothetical protein [Candidatus Pantoea persica]